MMMDFDLYTLVKVLAAQLLMPLPLCLGLFLLGLVLGVRRGVGRICMCVSVISLALLSWAPVADRLLQPFESDYPSLVAFPHDQQPKAVMVLGADYQPNQPWTLTGQLSGAAINRLAEGLRLWHQAPDLPLIVSGTDRRPNIRSMALGYAALAHQLGVPESHILALTEPRDTGEEAQAAARLLGQGASLILVTSASHMPRAVKHFRAAGLQPIPAPTHYLALRDDRDTLGYWIPSARHLRKSERAFYETLGLLAVRWE